MDQITAEETQGTKAQRLKLLNILQRRNNGWNALLDALKNCNQKYLIDKLQAALFALQQNKQLYLAEETAIGKSYVTLEEISIPNLWEVPQYNPHFTGRDSLLEQLSASLAPCELSTLEQQASPKTPQTTNQSNVTVISAVHGLGGVGKTQLAIEFIYRHQNTYPFIFWFKAEDTGQIDIAYQTLAQKFKIDTEQPTDAIIRDIKAWFTRHPGCLLVYDNAPDAEAIQKYLPQTGSNILVTSRNTQWYLLGNSFNVDVFTPSEARSYVEKILGNQSEIQALNTFIDRLGYLPLALAQAVAYVKKNNVQYVS